MSGGEQVVLGWAALRGPIPAVLGRFPLVAGVPDSLQFVDAVLLAVLGSPGVRRARSSRWPGGWG